MVAMLKGKFLHKDYDLILFRTMYNPRQKLMTMKEYIEDLYKINII